MRKDNYVNYFKAQENQRFSAKSLNQFWFKREDLFQINFKLGRLFHLVKHNGAVVLPDIRNV